jgi:hypothetical protein
MECFVIGPVGLQGLGLARRCIECRERGTVDADRCRGFGAGCMLTSAANDPAKPPQAPVSTKE